MNTTTMPRMIPVRRNADVMKPNVACIWVEGDSSLYSFVAGNGRSAYGRETITEVRRKYPGRNVRVLPWSEVSPLLDKAQRERYCKPVEEITEERFLEMLNVLPPENWVQHGDWEGFRISEYMTGNLTYHYVRRGERFFTACRACSKTAYEQLLAEIDAAFPVCSPTSKPS